MNTMKCVNIINKKHNIYLINVTTFFHYFNGCYQKENLLGGREHSRTWGDNNRVREIKHFHFEFSLICLQVYFQKWFPSYIFPRNRQGSEAELQGGFSLVHKSKFSLVHKSNLAAQLFAPSGSHQPATWAQRQPQRCSFGSSWHCWNII